MYDVLYSNTIQKCPLILYWIYKLQHSVRVITFYSFIHEAPIKSQMYLNQLTYCLNEQQFTCISYVYQ